MGQPGWHGQSESWRALTVGQVIAGGTLSQTSTSTTQYSGFRYASLTVTRTELYVVAAMVGALDGSVCVAGWVGVLAVCAATVHVAPAMARHASLLAALVSEHDPWRGLTGNAPQQFAPTAQFPAAHAIVLVVSILSTKVYVKVFQELLEVADHVAVLAVHVAWAHVAAVHVADVHAPADQVAAVHEAPRFASQVDCVVKSAPAAEHACAIQWSARNQNEWRRKV